MDEDGRGDGRDDDSPILEPLLSKAGGSVNKAPGGKRRTAAGMAMGSPVPGANLQAGLQRYMEQVHAPLLGRPAVQAGVLLVFLTGACDLCACDSQGLPGATKSGWYPRIQIRIQIPIRIRIRTQIRIQI